MSRPAGDHLYSAHAWSPSGRSLTRTVSAQYGPGASPTGTAWPHFATPLGRASFVLLVCPHRLGWSG
ncbi:MAG: hypothetical protein U0797_29630 [Gemmataceae bacterium]